MSSQQIPNRDVPVNSALDLVTRANSHPAFTSVVDVDLEALANSYPPAIRRASNRDVLITSAEDVDLKALANSYPPAVGRPTIREVVEGFLALRRHQRVKPGTLATEGKRLARFERAMAMAGLDHLPADLVPIMDYLGRFNGESGRHRRNQQDIVAMLYRYAHRQFGHLSTIQAEESLRVQQDVEFGR